MFATSAYMTYYRCWSDANATELAFTRFMTHFSLRDGEVWCYSCYYCWSCSVCCWLNYFVFVVQRKPNSLSAFTRFTAGVLPALTRSVGAFDLLVFQLALLLTAQHSDPSNASLAILEVNAVANIWLWNTTTRSMAISQESLSLAWRGSVLLDLKWSLYPAGHSNFNTCTSKLINFEATLSLISLLMSRFCQSLLKAASNNYRLHW